MAAMEKITFPPLIAHLQENRDVYNDLYKDYEIRYGQLNKSAVTTWIVTVIEPLIIATTQNNTEKTSPIFKALYTELLGIIGNQQGIIYEQEYKKAWEVCSTMPSLMQKAPGRIIKAIDTALVSIRTYQPHKVLQWISMMKAISTQCVSVEEFLDCGRINAWLCGLAHLRSKAIESHSKLRAELKESLQQASLVKASIEESIKSPWWGRKHPEFKGEAGGFIGYAGTFTAPPIVALIGNDILATDSKNTCALYADSLGTVMIADIPVIPEVVINKSINKITPLKDVRGDNLIAFNDISSCVVTDTTLILTRHSSHYLYIYGWS